MDRLKLGRAAGPRRNEANLHSNMDRLKRDKTDFYDVICLFTFQYG